MIRTPIESCPHWSTKTTQHMNNHFNFPSQSDTHLMKEHTAPPRSIGGRSRPDSRVELRRFKRALDVELNRRRVYTGATVGAVSRCVESWLCGNFITCMVHGSVDLPSALSPLSHVRMLVGVVHMKPFLMAMTWPWTMNAPSSHTSFIHPFFLTYLSYVKLLNLTLLGSITQDYCVLTV